MVSPQPITLERSNEDDIRVVSYNTWNEGILDNDRQIHFKRILQSLDPDIIALQEHGDWDDIDDIIQSWFPMRNGMQVGPIGIWLCYQDFQLLVTRI